MNKPEIIGYSQDGPTDQWGAKLQMQSAEASPKPTGPLPVVGSGGVVGGGLPPAEVEGFDGWLSLQITACHRAEKINAELGDYIGATRMRHTAAALASAQYQFRRRVGDASDRQPTPNIGSQTQPPTTNQL